MLNKSDQMPELNDPSFTEDDSNETPPNDIVAYNELRSCADLHRMHKEKILKIDPDFQRDFVWHPSSQTRFIDSLTKQLPIPSMCFALDYKNDRWIVIDGLQRISTIIRFLDAGEWKLSDLEDIDEKIAGKTVDSIKQGPHKNLYTRVQNQTLPINVLRCDFSKKTHMDYLFTIFHRLNSGGTKLNNQEIRNCIYGGSLNDLLKKLDQNPYWRKINSMEPNENYRFVKRELILRFFAFLDDLSKYEGKIATFLNNYMHENKNPSENFILEKESTFNRVCKLLADKIFTNPSKITTNLMEALLVAIATNIAKLETKSSSELKAKFASMKENENFKDKAVAQSLGRIDKVRARFDTAKNIFR